MRALEAVSDPDDIARVLRGARSRPPERDDVGRCRDGPQAAQVQVKPKTPSLSRSSQVAVAPAGGTRSSKRQ